MYYLFHNSTQGDDVHEQFLKKSTPGASPSMTAGNCLLDFGVI
jgi:hypothetical protein